MFHMRHAARLVAIGLAFGPGSRPVAAAPCPMSGEEFATIAAVEARLELRLVDGRLLRLAGLDPPQQTPDDPDLGETARMRLGALLVGKAVSLHLLSGTHDRWGRFPALVFTTDGSGAAAGLTGTAVATGLGRYLAEPGAHACRDALLAAEDKARLAKLGLWSDPYYALLGVDDHAAFMERSGTIVVAEGRLTGVLPSPYRTTLRFAAPTEIQSGQHQSGGHMLVATILPHAMKAFEAQKVDVHALIGQRLRFRGLLDLRFGPRIELTSPDQVETTAAAPPRSN